MACNSDADNSLVTRAAALAPVPRYAYLHSGIWPCRPSENGFPVTDGTREAVTVWQPN
ncbi:hypothetical protein HOE425_333174 [Hoeflea sp. EC-HK425]|nr:hypothetical protein HOE425_333174 [Hoeflea sp. EC-HK425]